VNFPAAAGCCPVPVDWIGSAGKSRTISDLMGSIGSGVCLSQPVSKARKNSVPIAESVLRAIVIEKKEFVDY
jgi:hypothetical protein